VISAQYSGAICFQCERFMKSNEEEDFLPDELKCEAFPFGIPESILLSEADHREPFAGDGGLQYQPVSEEERP